VLALFGPSDLPESLCEEDHGPLRIPLSPPSDDVATTPTPLYLVVESTMPLLSPADSGASTQSVTINLSTDNKPLNISYTLHAPRSPVNPDAPLIVRIGFSPPKVASVRS
jgi:hypothetical protein